MSIRRKPRDSSSPCEDASRANVSGKAKACRPRLLQVCMKLYNCKTRMVAAQKEIGVIQNQSD